MKLLLASIDFPYPPTNGHRIRAWAFLRSLAAEGHTVTLLTFAAPGDPSPEAAAEVRRAAPEILTVPLRLQKGAGARSYGRALAALVAGIPYGLQRFRCGAMRSQIAALLANRRFDAVVFGSCYSMVNCPPDLDLPVLLDNDNVEHVLIDRYRAYEPNPLRRAYAIHERRAMRQWECAAWTRADRTIFCSEHDRRLCLDICPGVSAKVVPNVIDFERYEPVEDGCGATLVYVGGMDWFPNRDAVTFFAFEVLPQLEKQFPGVEFVVGGRGPEPAFRELFRGRNVSFTGTVPDIRPVLARADVCVVPLRIGSGTRLKILEAAAMGKAVVSTSVGAEGLGFVDGKEILLADGSREFAAATARLLADAPYRVSLGAAARSRVAAEYTLDAMRRGIRTVFDGLGRAGAARGVGR